MTEQRLLKPGDLAETLGIPVKTLSQWRYFGTGPAYLKVGHHVRYRAEDVAEWLEAQKRGGPNAAA